MTIIPFWTMDGTTDLAALTDADVSAARIADTLSKINRFNGRTRQPWSVAEHSVLVEALCPIDLKGWGLLHDAHEAFIGDITSPAVDLIASSGTASAVRHAVANAKGRLDRVIGAAWECPPRSMSQPVRHADWIALHAEAAMLMNTSFDHLSAAEREMVERACELIREINPAGGWKGARDAWLDRAEDLSTMGLLRLPRC